MNCTESVCCEPELNYSATSEGNCPKGSTWNGTVCVFPPAAPPCSNPVILIQPVGGSIIEPSSFLFSVLAVGVVTFQWKKDGVNIPGATNSTYLIASSVIVDTGIYMVEVKTSGGCSTLS